MYPSVIHYKLDLLVRLIDTTTGMTVEERNVMFWRDGKAVRPVPRGSGNYVFLNCGREDCTLDIRVYGYDPCQASIRYETLDCKMPMREVFLIPSEDTGRGQPVITFSGRLSGMEAIQAVSLDAPCCTISEFNEKKRIMKLFTTHRSGMEDIYYGLIHPDRQDYEPFEVVRQTEDDSVEISRPLKEPFSVNHPIARVIFGRAAPDGSYCIRVRDNSDRLTYLIRYVAAGEVKFKTVDFHHLEGVRL